MTAEVLPEPDLAALGRDVSAWLVQEGLTGLTISGLLNGFADRLSVGGLRLSRAYLAMATISPEIRAVSVTWRRGRDSIRDDVEHDRFPIAFETSPIHFLIANNIPRRRWRIGREGGTGGYGLLEELRQEGDTDYIAEVVRFGSRAAFAVEGVAFTACSDGPDGFTEAEVLLMSELTQPLALATYRISLFDIAVDVLGAYLGHDAGLRVLNGQIRRGQGQSVGAALMVADLSGFTAASETGGEALVARLGEHLTAMVTPIEAVGGEVLKFLGDGILAGFPTEETNGSGACAAALDAACRAIALNDAVNALHPGEPPLPLKVGLHRGEVFYGNVGAGTRLDFTVIGPAVNEASRLEALCGALGRRLLMSSSFAQSCGREAVSLGLHELRGVTEPREIFTLEGF